MREKKPKTEKWNIDDVTLLSFVEAVESGYLDNPYHNSYHALGVLHAMQRMLKLCAKNGSDVSLFDETDELAMVLAAFAHDIGHFGRNNEFLVNAAHDLAYTYNDQSPNEHMHCVTLFNILKKPECNVLKNSSKAEFSAFRKIVIELILATDMVHHFPMAADVAKLCSSTEPGESSMNSKSSSVVEKPSSQKPLLRKFLFHMADISDPLKSHGQHLKYVDRIIQEFNLQHEEAQALNVSSGSVGMIVKQKLPMAQMGFLEYIELSSVCSMIQLFPQLAGLSANLKENFAKWSEHGDVPEDQLEGVRGRASRAIAKIEAAEDVAGIAR